MKKALPIHFRLSLVAGVLFLLAALGLGAQETASTLAREYGIDHWGEQEGVTHPRIKSIIQSHDGYLWLGTSAGVVRFDGVSFTSFNMQNGSLRENIVSGLVEDKNGSLYIATAGGGVTILDRGRVSFLTSTNGLPDDSIYIVDKDKDGNLWLGTQRGVCRITGRKVTSFGTASGLPEGSVSLLSANSSLGLVVSDGNRIYRLVKERFEVQPALVDSRDGLVSLLCGTRDGSLWISFESGLLKRIKDGAVTVYRRDHNVPPRPSAIYRDPQGIVWVGATDGVWRLQGNRFERLSFAADKALHGAAWSITSDTEGSLWIGFESDGLARLRRSRVNTLTTVDGLPDESTRAVFCDSKQRIWIGTGGGLVRLENGVATRFVDINGEPVASVSAIGETGDRAIWVGVGGRLMIVRNERLAPHPDWKNVQDIRVIYRDPLNRMWVGTDDSGLFKIEGNAITHYGTQDGLLCNQIRSVLLDRENRLWVGTFKGLNRWENGKFVECRISDRVSPSRVVDIKQSSDGAVWFATRSGLSRFCNGRFFNYTAENGLFGTYPYCILEEEPDFLWLSCFQGIFRVSKTELDRLDAGQLKKVSSYSIGIRDGLISTAFVGGTQPPGCKTPDGRFLFCSLKGVVVVDPKKLTRNEHVPPVIIENVRIDEKSFPAGLDATAEPGKGNVQFEYAGLSFLNPEKVRFRYRLEGFDKEWVEAGTRRLVYYANLPPGSYSFHVIACNDDGIWNTKGASFKVTLLPHFFQTKWFLVVCALWLVLFVGIYIQLNISNHQKRERELQKRVDEALAKVKVLSGLLPICASCKKVRDDRGYWNQLESYLLQHSSLALSHGICPDCMRKLYPDMADQILAKLESQKPGNPSGKNSQ